MRNRTAAGVPEGPTGHFGSRSMRPGLKASVTGPPAVNSAPPVAAGPSPNVARALGEDRSVMLWNLPLALTALLVMNHFARPFERFLTGYKIPLVLCVLGVLVAFFGPGLSVLKSRVGIALCLLLGWMTVCVPLSFWRGGSAGFLMYYAALWPVFFALIATTPRSLRDLRRITTVILVSCSFYILVGIAWGGGQRLQLSGTFGNSDDVALLAGFTLPFLVFWASQIKTFLLRACLLAGGAGFLLWVIGYTGTRAAIPALAGMFLVYFIRGGAAQRIGLITITVVGGLLVVTILPDTIVKRLSTVFSALNSEKIYAESGSDEAMASMAQRNELIRDALQAGADHLIFGVGPGQFVNYRFERMKGLNGRNKPYLPSHNTYLEVFSEDGLPGAILYIAFLGTVYWTVRRARKLNAPGSHPEWRAGFQLAISLEAALVYFAVCAFFMTCDQHPHQFAIAGLALALERITTSRIQKAAPLMATAGPSWRAAGPSFQPAFSARALAGNQVLPSPARRAP